MKSVIRLSAPASTTMPAIEPSSSEWYSPWPACSAAVERSENTIVTSPAT
jgi:hypothetical protein